MGTEHAHPCRISYWIIVAQWNRWDILKWEKTAVQQKKAQREILCYLCLATFPNHKSCVSRRLAFSFAELFVPWKALGLRLRASLWEKTCIVTPPGPSCLDKQKSIEFLAQDLHVASCGIMWHHVASCGNWPSWGGISAYIRTAS
jgi:hypothetical protein